jgi:CubicO group peptidase (beta-lactamase class C family)
VSWCRNACCEGRPRAGSFSYCTAGVVLLGVAVARALGVRLSVFAARELFPAAGIDRFDWPTTPRCEDSAAGGLLLTSRGLLGLGSLYLQGGGGVVSESWVDVSTRPHAQIDAQTGYLWWLRSFAGQRSYYMSGMGGNRVHVFPELELVAVITTRSFDVPSAHELSDRLLVDEVLARFG